ncbi:MAG TPA: UvrD-helicase domain-containing protein [Clostridiales bacterium]|nr:UvrD-helicase domain-containing protein [Clostridiales bacterium]
MTDLEKKFIDLRRKVVEKDFARMNDMQFKAVTTTQGPVLVLAGAGSGKTTVLVNRISYLIKYGNAYNSDYIPHFTQADLHVAEDYISGTVNELPSGVFTVNPARPWEVLAITFTNKAANELKERIEKMLGSAALEVTAGTFHSVCAKILRRYADRLGFSPHYTIYDTDDQKRLMKDVLSQLKIDEKILPVRSVLSIISSAKDKLISPEQFAASCGNDYRLQLVAKAYNFYQKCLQSADAMDFDDLIVNTVKLFEQNPDVLDIYQNKYKYIMVDEYQDTNHAQYVLVSKLAEKYGNICVVGDDDQSIYRFRGATIDNILNFDRQYKNAKVIRLEQNYRSTQTILNVANAVIANNTGRKGKNLWTHNPGGEPVVIFTASNEQDEARFVADSILSKVQNGMKFSDFAVLYRMNAQSNTIENVFVRSGIPYRIIGGYRFYERKEIKDVIAYLNVINNPADNIRLVRIINEPKRGIGEATISAAQRIADGLGVPLYEVLKNADYYPDLSRASKKIAEFVKTMEELISAADTISVHELLELTLDKTGYMAALQSQGEEAQDRIDNINELSSSILLYESENPDPSLAGFLEEVALVSDIDSYDSSADAVVMMTLHSAKGLEFNNVYIIGMEEGIFPGTQSIYGPPDEIEEERRLAYVGITRARKSLTLTKAQSRLFYGKTSHNPPSRFLKEIPTEFCRNETSSLIENINAFPTAAVPFSKSRNASKFTGFQPASKSDAVYKIGQRVKHRTFGEGLVLSVTPMGNDNLLEIAFDTHGTKKIMSNYAKLEILD